MFGACSDELDLKPVDQLTPEEVFDNATNANAAVLGLYTTMRSSHYYGQAFLAVNGFSALSYRHNQNFAEYEEYVRKDIRVDNAWSLNMWNAMYKTINAANNVIAGVPEINGYENSEELKNYVREAKFVRAHTLFNMVRMWGDIPMPLTPTTTVDGYAVTRIPADQVYAQIVLDLEQAINLPDSYGTTNETKGRATSLAAKALLAKVSLYTEDYSRAAILSDEIINSGDMAFSENFSDIWQVGNTSESIFELQFDDQNQNSFANNSAMDASVVLFYARDGVLNLYDEGDLRKDFTVQIDSASGEAITYVGKYRVVNPAAQNTPILRLAEMYLIYAEAQARVAQGVDANAYIRLSELRTERGLTTPAIGDFNLSSWVTFVQEEKRREMMFEAEVWFDYCRTGLALESETNGGLNVPSQDRYLYPIPSDEINVSGLSQNKAYL